MVPFCCSGGVIWHRPGRSIRRSSDRPAFPHPQVSCGHRETEPRATARTLLTLLPYTSYLPTWQKVVGDLPELRLSPLKLLRGRIHLLYHPRCDFDQLKNWSEIMIFDLLGLPLLSATSLRLIDNETGERLARGALGAAASACAAVARRMALAALRRAGSVLAVAQQRRGWGGVWLKRRPCRASHWSNSAVPDPL